MSFYGRGDWTPNKRLGDGGNDGCWGPIVAVIIIVDMLLLKGYGVI